MARLSVAKDAVSFPYCSNGKTFINDFCLCSVKLYSVLSNDVSFIFSTFSEPGLFIHCNNIIYTFTK